MMPLLEPAYALTNTTEDAAVTAIRNTGTRLNAPAGDIELVLDILFGELNQTISDTAAKR